MTTASIDMDKIITKKKSTYVLELPEEHANWLRGVLQNPLNDIKPDDENDYNKRMRHAIFAALKEVMQQ